MTDKFLSNDFCKIYSTLSKLIEPYQYCFGPGNSTIDQFQQASSLCKDLWEIIDTHGHFPRF